LIDRIKAAQSIDKIIVCTSTHPQDDPLEQIAARERVSCFRGHETDVMARLLGAAEKDNLSHFANITADCPMMDPFLIDRAVNEYLQFNPDIARYDGDNNDLPFNCYVVRVSTLRRLCEMKLVTDTEIWQRFFNNDPSVNTHFVTIENMYRHTSLKTSLDYPEDYEFIQRIFDILHDSESIFSLMDVINLVNARPELLSINSNPKLLQRWRDHQRLTSQN